MPHPIEAELVTRLFQRTTEGQIDWETTAVPNALSAIFAGKYVIILVSSVLGGPAAVHLSVKNADGDELSTLTGLQEPRLVSLYELASSHARKEVEAQLADLIKELDNPSLSDERAKRARLIEKARETKGRLSDMK